MLICCRIVLLNMETIRVSVIILSYIQATQSHYLVQYYVLLKNEAQLGQGLTVLVNNLITFQALEHGRKQLLQRRNVTSTIQHWEGCSKTAQLF